MIRSELLDEEVARNISAHTQRVTPVAERRSSIYLSKFEVARVVGERARQIVNDAALNMSEAGFQHSSLPRARDVMEVAERCTNAFSLSIDPVMMAKQELAQHQIPMLVRRTWPDGSVEVIPVSELLVDGTMLDLLA